MVKSILSALHISDSVPIRGTEKLVFVRANDYDAPISILSVFLLKKKAIKQKILVHL